MGERKKQTDKSGASKDTRFLFNRHFFTGKLLFLGLVLTQIIATLHVSLSNRGLFHDLEILKDAGYMTVPNHIVMNSLLEFGPAFYGGLFFTLTVGALLSLLGIVSAFMWNRFFKNRKTLLIPFLIIWAGLTGSVNIKGFSPLITAYFLFIPSIVFITASKYMPPVQQKKTGDLKKILFIIPVLLVVTFWTTGVDSGIFTDIRDHLLLSNSPGIKINNFYYRYTLYPAEAIKSLDQKIIRTFRFDRLRNKILADRIRKILTNNDFLEVNGNDAVDLSIDEQNNSLNLSNKGRIILTASARELLSNTEQILKEFSVRLDRKEFFRHFMYISLLAGFPVAIFIFLYSILGFILNVFSDYRYASTISLSVCLAAAVLISLFFHHISGRPIEENNISSALISDNWHDRVLALRIIDKNKMDISRFGNYHEMLSSPSIPVRYWFARVLSTGHDQEGSKALLTLMDDTSSNVACMAYYSLGQRGEKNTINEILKRVQLSDNWYKQRYAYKALRALGWKQTISK